MLKTLLPAAPRARTLAAIIAIAVLFVSPALAESKTIILSVPGMTCAACPITVKTALARVKGVNKVAVSFERKEAVVVFDDSRTNVEALKEASRNAGYPATVKR